MEKELQKSVSVLKTGDIILYPTDTIWGIGCDATDEKAVEKIYKIKQRSESKSLIILVDTWEMLQKYVDTIPEKVSCILKGSSKPTTVIYKNPIGLANNIIANDNTIAIRIVQDEFCKKLIQQFGKPIVSTSANISGEPTPKSFDEINSMLLKKVDYIVSLPLQNSFGITSQIVKVLEDGKIEFLRK